MGAHRFKPGDCVTLVPDPVDRIDYGTITGLIEDPEAPLPLHYRLAIDGMQADGNAGPFYYVNVGNIFADEWVSVWAESELLELIADAGDNPGWA